MPIENCELGIARHRDAIDRLGAQVLHWLATAGLSLFAVVPVLLGWRRLAGALETPLHPAVLASVGVAVAAAAAGLRLAWRPATRTLAWVLPLAVLGVGAALSLPGSSPLGLTLLWTVLLGEECWAWCSRWRRRPATSSESSPSAARPQSSQASARPDRRPLPAALVLEGVPAGDVLQQVLRRRAADGSEVVSGWLRVPLAPGQRTANIHVAFCPPFARTPQVTAEQQEGPEARIKKVQVLPYGARFDLKLVDACEAPATALLQFSARCGPPFAANVETPSPDAEHGGES